ncbi:formate dehydrogenase accessory sulfurtransferase FdhD [Cohnella lupini]|uniref:Sulfur carrier protein FdhD n=1 Tax=Cohnella lupini TaxID=1294267 RepID=A0A3D9IU65_9BACL|nr:formate dehydrogenase accessory sulfurtransferase FdhD [Cohnella lupini]RED64656.1 FdhD protein [Cohnella lupini]
MDDSASASRVLIRYEDGSIRKVADKLATERPITIVVNGEEFATLVCTPGYVEDMAVGYLASEGVLEDVGNLADIGYDDRTGMVYAEIGSVSAWIKESGSKRYLSSCCGKSRPSFVFYGDARTTRPVDSRDVSLSYDTCIRMMTEMQEQSGLFRQTGGVHNAALFSREGTLLLTRMDIGRHNALDKLYGYSLRNGVKTEETVLAFSGRVSSEVLLKAAKMRCEILLSKSAATDLAIELAEQLGITVVGFIRNRSLNVYSHPERIYEGV